MRVDKIITRDLTAVTADDTLRDAVRTMASHRIGGLPVVDDDLRVIGFISIKDVIETAYPYSEASSEDLMITARLADFIRGLHKLGGKQVKDCMTTPTMTTHEEEDLEEIASQMISRGLKIMPVIKDDRLIGIVRRRDLAVALIEEGEED